MKIRTIALVFLLTYSCTTIFLNYRERCLIEQAEKARTEQNKMIIGLVLDYGLAYVCADVMNRCFKDVDLTQITTGGK